MLMVDGKEIVKRRVILGCPQRYFSDYSLKRDWLDSCVSFVTISTHYIFSGIHKTHVIYVERNVGKLLQEKYRWVGLRGGFIFGNGHNQSARLE